jgi:hypothetical protein
MATTLRRTAAKLHLLTTKQVQHAAEGDHSDGGGLLLRVRGESCSWVLRYTSPTGRRREMGLGAWGPAVAEARPRPATASPTPATPLTKAEKARERWTLARCARDYDERAVEPRRTDKHAPQWPSSLENTSRGRVAPADHGHRRDRTAPGTGRDQAPTSVPGT